MKARFNWQDYLDRVEATQQEDLILETRQEKEFLHPDSAFSEALKLFVDSHAKREAEDRVYHAEVLEKIIKVTAANPNGGEVSAEKLRRMRDEDKQDILLSMGNFMER